MKNVLFVLILIFLGFGCINDTWIGFYYPDVSDLSNNKKSEELESIGECRLWVEGQQNIYNLEDRTKDDYECCKNGKYDSRLDMFICEETVR